MVDLNNWKTFKKVNGYDGDDKTLHIKVYNLWLKDI